MKPEISINIEGYNETLEIGALEETLAALRAQLYPLDRVEVLLIGSSAQIKHWAAYEANPAPFAAIRAIDAGESRYYALKNRGARESAADILVFIDSDIAPLPGWLGSLVAAINAGATATCGPSLFRDGSLESSRRLPLLVAAAISWGFIVGKGGRASGFLSHNLGFQRDAFERIGFREEFGRTLAGSVLLDEMNGAGIQPVFVPEQRVAHAFQWRWWFTRLHVRFGHEVYLLHRLNFRVVSRYARFLGPLDAIATPCWHVLLDFPKWWRYSGVLGVPLIKRLAGLILVLPCSFLARGGEMAGMVRTVFSEGRMRAFAERN